jgi:two-component sensor histidine kinase
MLQWLGRYSLALVTPAAALGLTWLLPPLREQTSTPLLLASILVSAWWGGLGPGLVATAGSVVTLHYFVLPPLYTVAFSWVDIVRLPVFLAVALLIAFLQGRRGQAEAALRGALAQKEVLLQEVHHRVKNNLQVMTSLLNLQAGAVPDPQLRRILEDSRQRLQAIAFMHEIFHRTTDLERLEVRPYLRTLLDHLFRVYHLPGQDVRLSLELAALAWDINQAMTCGLILHELVSNSLTHAFPLGRAGEIAVTLAPEPPGRCTLVVRDTGVGLPEGFDLATTRSLGLRLVGLLARQLEGTLTLARNGGTRVTITFPC